MSFSIKPPDMSPSPQGLLKVKVQLFYGAVEPKGLHFCLAAHSAPCHSASKGWIRCTAVLEELWEAMQYSCGSSPLTSNAQCVLEPPRSSFLITTNVRWYENHNDKAVEDVYIWTRVNKSKTAR